MTRIVLLLLCLVLAASEDNCVPFGLRVQYGQRMVSTASTEKMIIAFNTADRCDLSYVTIFNKNGFTKIQCDTIEMKGSVSMNYFTTYAQRCLVSSEINFGETFFYNVYGWANSKDNPEPYKEEWIEIYPIDPQQRNRDTNVVVLADWGVIEGDKMTPIMNSLNQLLTREDIHLMVIMGDIAYDLDSDNGQRYLKFVELIEEFTRRIPIVIAPGNHEHFSDDDMMLLSNTYQLYGVDDNLAAGLYFGSTYLLPFDPFNLVYRKPEEQSSFQALRRQLEIGRTTGLFIIPFSHYPLICSAEAEACTERLSRINQFFDVMIENQVSLYLGAHTHSYQRNYPYFRNKTFQKIESPYSKKEEYLISIVQGVAGNNISIITEMPAIQDYTAKWTANETGFGVLRIRNQSVNYAHFSTKRGFIDQITISKEANLLPPIQDIVKSFGKILSAEIK